MSLKKFNERAEGPANSFGDSTGSRGFHQQTQFRAAGIRGHVVLGIVDQIAAPVTSSTSKGLAVRKQRQIQLQLPCFNRGVRLWIGAKVPAFTAMPVLHHHLRVKRRFVADHPVAAVRPRA